MEGAKTQAARTVAASPSSSMSLLFSKMHSTTSPFPTLASIMASRTKRRVVYADADEGLQMLVLVWPSSNVLRPLNHSDELCVMHTGDPVEVSTQILRR